MLRSLQGVAARHLQCQRAACGLTNTRLVQHARRSSSSGTSLSNDEDLAGRRCLVTGGTSGIGLAIAKHLALRKASVIIVGRNEDRGHQGVGEIKAVAPEANVQYEKLDLTHSLEATGKWWKDRASTSHDQPVFNTLINCAGITQTSNLLTTSTTALTQLQHLNLSQPINLCQLLLKDYHTFGRSLQKRAGQDRASGKSFCVINVSSLLAVKSGSGASVYAATKAGLIAFTRALVLDAAALRTRFSDLQPFRANVVVPGYIDTPMIEAFAAQHKTKLEQEIPLGRYGTPDEVADAVVFMVRNEYANNTVLNLDGGLGAT